MSAEEPFLSENMHGATDEDDETLSLSDLPLYGDQSVQAWEADSSVGTSQGSSSSSSSEQDCFEFFSQELSSSATIFPPENFIFCGKLIPYRKPDASEDTSSDQVAESKKKKHGWSIFGWKITFSFSTSSKGQAQSKGGRKSTKAVAHKKHRRPSSNSKKHGKGYGFPLQKMPVLTSTPSGKARWYLFLSGIPRFSSEMELRDIRSRQNRRHSPPPSLTLKIHDDTASQGDNKGLPRLWGLIRVLSCGINHHPNTMVVRKNLLK